MSNPSKEQTYAEWLEWIITDFKKEFGRVPTIEEVEDIMNEGDWRRGEE